MPTLNSPVYHIVIHCSDSPHRNDTAKEVHRWHVHRGWDGIGYHYTIDEHGVIEAGRPEYWKGAHVKGHNSNSLGIMLFGKTEQDYTEHQWKALEALIRTLLNRHHHADVVGHYQLDPRKSCPNFDVPKWCVGRNFPYMENPSPK